jgi:hypothetical protein
MTFQEVVNYFNSAIEKAETHASAGVAIPLQHAQCDTLELLLHNASRFKSHEIAQRNENLANLFLGYEGAIGTVLSELRMWILLKMDKGNLAWEQLIAAQMAALDAARSHKGFAHAAERIPRLVELESLFTSATYLSAGFSSSRLECSICEMDYAKCNHLRDMPYMGQLCQVKHHDILGNHVALVKAPADKRCRVISIKTPEGHEDKITLAVTPYGPNEQFVAGEGMELNAIIMVTDRYPYLKSNKDVFDEASTLVKPV